MAALGRAFQMKVVAYNRSARPDTANVDRMLCAEWGDTPDPVIEEADVIMLATQLTDETYHLFSTEVFSRMRSTAYMINMARGAVIDETALLNALTRSDVFTPRS